MINLWKGLFDAPLCKGSKLQLTKRRGYGYQQEEGLGRAGTPTPRARASKDPPVRALVGEGSVAIGLLVTAEVVAHPKHGDTSTATRQVFTGQLIQGQRQRHIVAVSQQLWEGRDLSRGLWVLEVSGGWRKKGTREARARAGL